MLTATLTATSADDGSCKWVVGVVVGRAKGVAQGVDGLALEAEPYVGVDAGGDADVGVSEEGPGITPPCNRERINDSGYYRISSDGIPALYVLCQTAGWSCLANFTRKEQKGMVADIPVVAFLAKIEHGCLILQDAGSNDDVSDWDPTSSSRYQEGSTLIFGVQTSVDGPVECEVWKIAAA